LIDGNNLLAWINGSRSSKRDADAKRRSTAPDPYEVLGVHRGAADEEIKAAYRALMQQYHPDKVSHLALEYQEIAREKSQLINVSYQRILAERR
jgi:DnaJ-domain-containing protein 1